MFAGVVPPILKLIAAPIQATHLEDVTLLRSQEPIHRIEDHVWKSVPRTAKYA